MANQPKRLYRDTDNKMIAGVCAGLAEYFDIDVTLVRIIAVLLVILPVGGAVIAYIIMWAVVPERPNVINTTVASSTGASAEGETMSGSAQDPSATAPNSNHNEGTAEPTSAPQPEPSTVNTDFSAKNHPVSTVTPHTGGGHGGVYAGIFLVLVGVFALLAQFFGDFSWWSLWPLFIVAAGVLQMFFPDKGHPWTPWRIVDGLITIGVGLVFLGCTVGWISWDVFWRFFTYWPVLIIAAGFGIMGVAMKQHWISSIGGIIVALVFFTAALFSYTGPGALSYTGNWSDGMPFVYSSSPSDSGNDSPVHNSGGSFSEPLGSTQKAELTLNSGAGQYDIEALDASQLLFSAESSKANALNCSSGGSTTNKEVTIETNNTSTNAKIDLSRDVAWSLKLTSGATDNDYDLRHLKVTHVDIETGASNNVLRLGEPMNDNENVVIESGFAAFEITAPSNVPVRITSDTGLVSKNFNGLIKQADGSYTNAAYDTNQAMSRVIPVWNIHIEGGLANFDFNFE